MGGKLPSGFQAGGTICTINFSNKIPWMAYPLDEFYSRIYKRYDLINRLFTIGMDKYWRKVAASQCIGFRPDTILDLCCGTGDLTIMLAREGGGKISITGFDRNSQMLDAARQKSTRKGFHNIGYIQGDALQMPFASDSFDCITIGFGFRNLTYDNPLASGYISEMSRVLKKSGKLLILESGIPENRWIRLLFKCYLTLILIPIGFILSGDRQAYRYLAHSAANFYTTDELMRMLSGKGLQITATKIFFMGAASLITAEKL
jgi:demethylmenaquinone methyltransferase/2-methoxy-6-polyprenyl-1,4-benzoquinol methylase